MKLRDEEMAGDYYKTKASVDEYIRLAKDVDGERLIDKLKEFLPSQSSLLELGTGPGTDWEILSKDYKVIGSDNSVEFLNHLNTEYPDGRFIEIDAGTLLTDDKFDAIYSNKVLHHLKDDELANSVKAQSKALNNQGIICHSFWKGEDSEIFKGLFVNYHTEEVIRSVFSPYFEILVLDHYAEFEDSDSILVIGSKK